MGDGEIAGVLWYCCPLAPPHCRCRIAKSAKLSPALSPNPPPISIPPLDHSCVKQESPRANALPPPQSPKSTNKPPYTHRPFLRRQESILYRAATPPKRRRRWRHTIVRFLPTQEWSGGGTGNCGQNTPDCRRLYAAESLSLYLPP